MLWYPEVGTHASGTDGGPASRLDFGGLVLRSPTTSAGFSGRPIALVDAISVLFSERMLGLCLERELDTLMEVLVLSRSGQAVDYQWLSAVH